MAKINFPSSKEFTRRVANEALDNFEYEGLTIRQWADKIVNNEYREVKRGKWINGKYRDEWYCSVCRNGANLDWKENPILSDFCPKCGALMTNGR